MGRECSRSSGGTSGSITGLLMAVGPFDGCLAFACDTTTVNACQLEALK